MRGLNGKVLRALGFALVVLFASVAAHAQTPAGTWQPVKTPAPFSPGTALVLTDGTIMVEDYGPSQGGSSNWWSLTPDNTGSYVNGTWTPRASMQASYGPLYFASAVLDDGRYTWDGGLGTTWSNIPSQDLTVVVLTQRAADETGMPAVCDDVLSAARSTH